MFWRAGGREIVGVQWKAIFMFESMLPSQISSKIFKLQFSFFPLLQSD